MSKTLFLLVGVVVVAQSCLEAHAQVTFTPLGDLPGGTLRSAAFGVSADGSIVGRGTSALGEEALLWNDGGMHKLRDLLIANGATGLAGWRLTRASAISVDGLTIVGEGTNPLGQTEAWVATIPEPSPALAILASFVLLAPRRRRR